MMTRAPEKKIGRLRHSWLYGGTLWIGSLLCAAGPSLAIEVNPSEVQVQTALERGYVAAQAVTSPARLYAWFGPPAEQLKSHGFLMTKMAGLRVLGTHFALRGEKPSQEEVRQIVEGTSLLVTVMVFGSRPDLALDAYAVLEQGGKSIKPVTVRFDAIAPRSLVWPDQPAYRGKVVASFAYIDFDPKAMTKLSIFPAAGGEIAFDLNFAEIE